MLADGSIDKESSGTFVSEVSSGFSEISSSSSGISCNTISAGTSGFCEVIFADSGISASGIAFISWKFSGRIG